VIGEVAGLDLAWRPLEGKKIVVTRARDQVSESVAALGRLGASVIELPTVEIADPPDGGVALRLAAERLGTYDWVVLTSANAVERLLAAVHDARSFGTARIAAIGSATADALRRHGLAADLVPERFVAEALVDAFPAGSGRVLLPRAAVAREVVPDGLRAKGWDVDVVDAYQTVAAAASAAELEAAASADAVMFSSSSTIANYLAMTDRVPPVVACIGPVTARAAEAAGLTVDVVAEASTMSSLVDALTRRLGA
jgi:uroporphyrinogen III methyltransferase/synthase